VSEQTANIFLCLINKLVPMTEAESVYCAVRSESVNMWGYNLRKWPTRCNCV